jgi:16S rRNA processing protein RimM
MRQECPVACGEGCIYVKRSDEGYEPLKVVQSRRHGSHHVVSFEGYESRNDAEGLRGAAFFLPEADLPVLPEGEYYSYQILGMDVHTTDGRYLGKVTKIFTAGEHDIYVVKDGKEEVLIPAVDHVVVEIDLNEKRIIVDPIEGLLDE